MEPLKIYVMFIPSQLILDKYVLIMIRTFLQIIVINNSYNRLIVPFNSF